MLSLTSADAHVVGRDGDAVRFTVKGTRPASGVYSIAVTFEDAQGMPVVEFDGNFDGELDTADGRIVFPADTGHSRTTEDLLKLRQFDMASIIYRLGHLSSTWRGNWNDLEGSYLSQYGLNDDGVLELYSENGQKKMKFIKTNTTHPKYFTNPKSATIEGDYNVSEPVPKMYVLTPAKGTNTKSDVEMASRIGLFLDVFDGSAPEAGVGGSQCGICLGAVPGSTYAAVAQGIGRHLRVQRRRHAR